MTRWSPWSSICEPARWSSAMSVRKPREVTSIGASLSSRAAPDVVGGGAEPARHAMRTGTRPGANLMHSMDESPEPDVSYPRPGVAVLTCAGDHDMTTKEETGTLLAVLVAENDLVVVDVSDARFIDSSFVNNLLRADRLAR